MKTSRRDGREVRGALPQAVKHWTRAHPAGIPDFRGKRCKPGDSPPAGWCMDGIPPLIGAGLARLHVQPSLQRRKR